LRIVVRDGLTVCDTFRDPVFEIPIDLMFVFYCGSVLLIFLFYTLTQLRLSLCPSRRLAEMHRGNTTELAMLAPEMRQAAKPLRGGSRFGFNSL
jgi:hypothetical protein